ncbi:MAG: mechanosensitive ion channel family protein [Nocardioidaceae bacterium]
MATSWTSFLVTLGAAVAAAALVAVAAHLVVRALAHRWSPAGVLLSGARRPFRLFLLVAALSAVAGAVHPAGVSSRGWQLVELWLHVALTLVGAWLLTAALLFIEDLGLRRYRTDVRDNRIARQKRTQVLIIRRLTVGIMVVLAIGAALLSFPAVKAVGASVLASAGLVSVVAALAAQSTLGNVFAGIQLAFNDAIRLDDAVIVENEWGQIEELTLTYVVVRLWDDRRMVLPSTYFTTTPSQNWTRRSSELLGGVEFDLDWRVDTAGMRAELDRILDGTDLWDGRARALQVTDAVNGWVHVRVLVSADAAGPLFDLRCLVREQLVAWIRETNPAGLPRHRLQVVAPATTANGAEALADQAR